MSRLFRIMRSSIAMPWAMIAPHERRARLNHDQDLETLHRRGGLSASEALAVLDGHRWRPNADAEAELSRRVARFIADRGAADGLTSA